MVTLCCLLLCFDILSVSIAQTLIGVQYPNDQIGVYPKEEIGDSSKEPTDVGSTLGKI